MAKPDTSPMSFYDHTEAARVELTELALRDKRTLVQERWASLHAQEAGPWDERASIAAKLLSDDAAVVDLGCGLMTLERYLKPATQYIPIDVVRRDHRTIVCDFNKDDLPPLPATSVACLGLLEYILDVPKFWSMLTLRFDKCVLSYCIADSPKPLIPRRSHGWFNDYSKDDLEALFCRTGWSSQIVQIIGEFQALWLLSRAERV